MKVYALVIVSTAAPYERGGSVLAFAGNFPAKFTFHQKTLAETCRFLGRAMALHIPTCSRGSAEDEQKTVYYEKFANSLTAIIVSDRDYPRRLAYSLIQAATEQFTALQPGWAELPAEPLLKLKPLAQLLSQYSSQKNFPRLMQTCCLARDVVELVHENLKQVLINGENLEEIAVKSQDLSEKSKIFYQQSKRGCCAIF